MPLFKVYKARLTWDYFEVNAEHSTLAAKLVGRGKIPEKEIDVSPSHENGMDLDGTVSVLGEGESVKGFTNVMTRKEAGEY